MLARTPPAAPPDPARLRLMANALRALGMDAVEAAKSGHPGLPMGAADVAAVLFDRHLVFDRTDPAWSNRDRFVLSAGHGSMLLYALLHLLGYPGWTIDELKRFRQLGSRTPGHPEITHASEGVEMTTGPLGQGLATAVGMALAERALNARHGDALVDHRTYVLASDGDLMEGVSQEACALAGHLKLARLTVLWDDNGISIDGPLSLSDSTDQLARFAASGWATARVDGHDALAIDAALEAAKASDRPTLIACRTTIGFGAPTKAGKSSAHGSPLGPEELAGAKRALGWDHGPFEVPHDVRAFWGEAGARGEGARAASEARAGKVGRAKRAEFERAMKGVLPKGLVAAVREVKRLAAANDKPVATRKASEEALAAIAPVVPELVLGSADLTPSNNTRLPGAKAIAAGDYAGSFVHWGIREHAMAAAMNGISLHGGLIPASGTFLVFSDYCRPALRMAALMERRVVHVMTHDSIGVGEDGPTHQPVEHLASLRAIPNLRVYRPADRAEAAECWECALLDDKHPSVLALSRQDLPRARAAFTARNLSAQGAYELLPAAEVAGTGGKAAVSLFASGSEVSLAVEARVLLAASGIAARVVSVPCLDLFLEQPEALRRRVIGRARARVGVEAGLRLGWDAIIGSEGRFVGMTGFGLSGPYKEVYAHFGITAEAVAEAARAAIKPGRATRAAGAG